MKVRHLLWAVLIALAVGICGVAILGLVTDLGAVEVSLLFVVPLVLSIAFFVVKGSTRRTPPTHS